MKLINIYNFIFSRQIAKFSKRYRGEKVKYSEKTVIYQTIINKLLVVSHNKI